MFIGPPQAYSATAGLATWAGCSNEKTPPQLQILNWSEPYENVGGAIAIASLRKAPPTTIFSLFRHSKISIHLKRTLKGSLGLLRSQYTYEKLLYAGDSPSYSCRWQALKISRHTYKYITLCSWRTRDLVLNEKCLCLLPKCNYWSSCEMNLQ